MQVLQPGQLQNKGCEKTRFVRKLLKRKHLGKPSPRVFLTEGVLRTMLFAKLKTARVVFLVLSLGAGVGLQTLSGFGKQSDLQAQEEKKQPKESKDDQAKKELEKLQGTWVGIHAEANGEAVPEAEVKKFKVLIKVDKIIFNPETEKRTSTIQLDPSRQPQEMVLTPLDGPAKGKSATAIYSVEKDILKICMNNVPGGQPPTKFETKSDKGLRLLILKRARPDKEFSPR